MRTYRITHTYEIEAGSDQEAQRLGDNLAESMHYALDAAEVPGSWYPTTKVEEIELAKCRVLHGDDAEVRECWQERAREATPVALLQY